MTGLSPDPQKRAEYWADRAEAAERQARVQRELKLEARSRAEAAERQIADRERALIARDCKLARVREPLSKIERFAEEYGSEGSPVVELVREAFAILDGEDE